MAQSKSAFDELTSGRFLTVQWIKNDGAVRTLSGRFGVKKYSKNANFKPSPNTAEKYITIWSKSKIENKFNVPRMIKRDTILAIKAGGFVVYSNPCSDYAKLIKA